MAETTAVGFEPVDKAGDTMEGPLTLAGAPTTDLEAATKKYVDDNAAAPGANTSLSNLDSPTAVNQDIVPDGDNTRDLGSESNPFKALYLKEVRVPYDGVLPQDSLNFFAWNSVTSDWDVIFGVVSGAAPGVTFAGTTAFLNGFITITPAPGDNSHKLADTAFVQQELAAYTPPAPDWGDIGGTLSNQTDLQNALNSKADTSSLGNYATLLCNLNSSVDPTSADDSGDGYDIGSRWINVNTNKEFVCVDDAVGSAIWGETTGGAPFDRYTYETSSSTSSIEFPYGFGWDGKTTLSPSFPPTDDDTNLYFPAYDADTGGIGNILATRQSASMSSIPNNGHVAVMPYNSGSTNKICTSFHYSKLVMGQDGAGYCAPFTSTGKSNTVSLSPDNDNAIAGLVFLQRGLYKRVSIYVKVADAGMQAEAAIYNLGNNRRAGLIESEISAPVSLGSTGEAIMIIDTDPIAGKRFGGFFWVVIRFIGTRTTLEIDACDGQNINLFVPMTTKTGESIYTMKYNSFSTFPATLGGTVPASFHGITECPYFVVGPSV